MPITTCRSELVPALNTMVLIFSSFTMAWGVRGAEFGQTRLLVRLLTITLVCGGVFLGVKFVECENKWEEALLPGKFYNPDEPPPGVEHAESWQDRSSIGQRRPP